MQDNTTSTRVLNFQKNIDTKEIIFTLMKKWYIIVSATIITFLVTLIYTTAFVTPMYSSTAKIIIFNKQQTTTTNDLELSSSLYLTKDFKEIITDKMVLGEVSSVLKGKYSISQLKGYISINNPTNTRIIEISALCPVPEDSKKIVDAVCDVSQEKLVELMGLDRITLISDGDVAKRPALPNVTRNLFFGTLGGFLAGCLIVFIVYLTDNKITSAEDVERIFDMSVLVTIPYNNKQKAKK